ncbi:Transposase and inactivated derivatives [Marinobacter segnicrescens]|uniref:Transposase and inactivated derivatives n=1 Tax=Marinobacter segnicrescens TaxID=430453 RepID=A0A1I0I9V9_9GAMM|nr:Transposase and inactivated derivatives [Marinobacter segnicrescens]
MMSAKRYSEEFKIEAVKQVTERGYKVSDVCRRLGITSGSLYKWIKLYGDPGSQHQHITEQQDELRQLRAELRRVTEERDILKKAAVDSTGQCNIMHTGNYRGFQNAAASIKDQRADLPAEAGAMGSMEERAVA